MHALVTLHDIVLAARGIFLELLKVVSRSPASSGGGVFRESVLLFDCE